MLERVCQVCDRTYPAERGWFCCSMECRDERTRRKREARLVDWACACGRVLRLTARADFLIEDDDVFVEIKGYEWGPSLEKVQIARKMGYNVIYADQHVLTGVFGLDLSFHHLDDLVEKTV